MQTFGKRDYDHMDLDPWAKSKPRSEPTKRERSLPAAKIAGYLVAVVTLGVIAFAGFGLLIMA
jgi:hypothetical protein